MSGRAGVLRVAIVGGGIGGVGAANARHQHGLDVKVYEQASALTEVGRVSPFSRTAYASCGDSVAIATSFGTAPAGTMRSSVARMAPSFFKSECDRSSTGCIGPICSICR
jgi:cation diffusion facilitator CzcD-associated flavoprotein CzcO